MSQTVKLGLRERKREATLHRIASEAARIVLEQGMAETTVDKIAEAASVGRASFFRYFDTKERAIAEGLSGVWLEMITEALRHQSPEQAPLDAIRSAFHDLAEGFDQIRELTLSQARLSRSSAALSAWTLQVYLGYEEAITDAVGFRFGDLEPNDPRARLLGAMVMAAVRLALDDWVASEGNSNLPTLIDRYLNSISISPTPRPALAASRKDMT